jgi:hypothetical protein
VHNPEKSGCRPPYLSSAAYRVEILHFLFPSAPCNLQFVRSGRKDIPGRIREMLVKANSSKLHIPDVMKSGESSIVNGFFSGSAAGKLRIPPDMRIIDNDGRLTCSGN